MAYLTRIDIEKRIAEKLPIRQYRQSYAATAATDRLATQIRIMRKKRGWTQTELAEKIGTRQSVISRLENPGYGKASLQTILDLAEAFDVWPSIEFLSFKDGLRRTNKRPRNAPSFATTTNI